MSDFQRTSTVDQPSLTRSTTTSVADLREVVRAHRYEERTSLLDEAAGEQTQRQYGSVPSARDGGPSSTSEDPPSGTLAKKIKYYIPSFSWIPGYSSSFLEGDILAGITLASILVPQSISYGTSLAHLTPTTGLFSASIPPIFYAFFGTSRQLNVAPEAALSLLIGQAVTEIRRNIPETDPTKLGIEVATIITFQAGMFSFLLGIFRLGFIDVVLSRALLRGFTTAVAVVIMIEQLVPMFGLTKLFRDAQPETTMDKIIFLVEHIFTSSHLLTAIIGFSALAVLIIMRAFKSFLRKYKLIQRIPEVLIVVCCSTFLSSQYRWDEDGVDILGSVSITHGGSFFRFPVRKTTVPFLRQTTSTAVLIAIIGFLDSIVAAKQNAARFRHTISPNRELVALGVSNLAGSFVPGTLPAYGSITRSRINGDIGARSQVSGLITGGLILLATFYLLPWLYFLPKAVLGSIICLVVWTIIAETPHDVIYYWRMGAWVDLMLMALTFFFSMIYDVEVGVIVSLIISLLLVVHRSSRARMTILGRIPGTDRWKPVNENPEAEDSVMGALIVRIRENLDFANTAQLKERLRRLELYGTKKSHPSDNPRRQEASVLVFHLADVETIDASAAQIFYELLEEYQSRGVGLYITHLAPGPRETFTKAGIVELLGHDAFRENVLDAMTVVERSRESVGSIG